MAISTSPSLLPDEPRCIGLLVAFRDDEPMLCPFFARCDGLFVISPDGEGFIHRADPTGGSRSICNLIRQSGVDRLICGFIGASEKDELLALGIDVRIGSCRDSLTDLAARSGSLPRA
jgi:predicted Fe-Mo cluster-binding NifX family protein